MNISLFLDSIERDEHLSHFIKEKVAKTLRRHRETIDRVDVRIRDINADKGGVDKECKLIVSGPHTTPLVIRVVLSDAGQAFRAALKRLTVNLRRNLDKVRSVSGRTRRRVRAEKQAA